MNEVLRLVQTTPPATEPLTKQEAKNFLRIDNDDDDTLIESLITAARMQCERYTGRALITQGWSLYLDHWPGQGATGWWDGIRDGADIGRPANCLVIPKAPLISVTQILIYDEDDQSQAWAASNYYVDTASAPGRVVLRNGGSTPAPSRAANGIEVQFTAGYGAAASSVPRSLIEGINRLAAHMYENRGDLPDTAMKNSGAENLWQPWRMVRLA